MGAVEGPAGSDTSRLSTAPSNGKDSLGKGGHKAVNEISGTEELLKWGGKEQY